MKNKWKLVASFKPLKSIQIKSLDLFKRNKTRAVSACFFNRKVLNVVFYQSAKFQYQDLITSQDIQQFQVQ